MNDELIVLIDEDGRQIGTAPKLASHHIERLAALGTDPWAWPASDPDAMPVVLRPPLAT